MAVSGIIFQMITLFIMMFAGYLAARAGLISPSFRRGLSSLVLSTAFPCCIVSSVLQSGGRARRHGRRPGRKRRVLRADDCAGRRARVHRAHAQTGAQSGPADGSCLPTSRSWAFRSFRRSTGAQGVAMLSMFLLVFNFLVFTYGVMLVSGNGSINLRQLVNPGVVSALIALLFGLTGWRLPSPVESALSSIGSINTPMAMMVIGSSLAHSDIRAAFSNPRLVSREPAAPDRHAAGLYRPRARRSDQPHACGICVIVAAMPIAGNCSMLSDIYTPEDMTASHATIVSTLLSGVTLPLLVAAMNMVGLG